MTNETAQLTATTNPINCPPPQPISIVPSHDELTVLVKHWVNEAIDEEYSIFLCQCFSLADIRQIECDWNRVNQIAEVLGDEATRTTVEEAYQQAAQDYDRNHWIVFRYGTRKEKATYQTMGGRLFEEFQEGVAERVASQVVERVFGEGPVEQQTTLLKEELRRYSRVLKRLKSGARNVIEIFGISFPAETKRLVLSIGIEDPAPNSQCNTFFETLTLEQGKAILAALDGIARKGEGAFKELVTGCHENTC